MKIKIYLVEFDSPTRVQVDKEISEAGNPPDRRLNLLRHLRDFVIGRQSFLGTDVNRHFKRFRWYHVRHPFGEIDTLWKQL